MSNGIFHLGTPRDLVKKARHDLQRLRDNPLDAYAAFDFFVAVRHVPDWLYPNLNEASKKKQLFKSNVELRIARHLADEGKHFKVTGSQHQQVKSTDYSAAVFQPGAFQPGFQTGSLTVELDPTDADTAKFGLTIPALELAERVHVAIEGIVPK
jgi:hypothetical protein